MAKRSKAPKIETPRRAERIREKRERGHARMEPNMTMATQIAIWTRKETGTALRVRVLGEKAGNCGERRFVVCKEESPNPMYQFSVLPEDLRAAV